MKPRFVSHVGLEFADAGDGTSELRLRIEAHHLNTNGVVHGGALFTLADTGMGVAVHGALAPSERCATVDARISYFRPVREGEVVCRSRVVHRGKRMAHVEAVLSVEGVDIATAGGVFSVLSPHEGTSPG